MEEQVKGIDLLLEEHRALESVLRALEASTRRLREGAEVPDGLIEDIFDFCRRFTDGCHHVHEETILFPALATHGLTPDLTPMSALAAQHESGRAFLRDLMEAYARFRAGDECAKQEVYVLAREYVSMLREHIAIEDHYFRSPAAQALTADENERLSRAILSCERGGGANGRAQFLERASRHRELVSSW
jgi:hemerythrin-like domain-containing protein